MILVPSIIVASCFVVATLFGLEARKAYRKMVVERFSDQSVSSFTTMLIGFAGCSIFAPASLVMAIVHAADGRVSDEWATSIAISFTLLGAFAIVLATTMQFIIEKVRDQLQENSIEVSKG